MSSCARRWLHHGHVRLARPWQAALLPLHAQPAQKTVWHYKVCESILCYDITYSDHRDMTYSDHTVTVSLPYTLSNICSFASLWCACRADKAKRVWMKPWTSGPHKPEMDALSATSTKGDTVNAYEEHVTVRRSLATYKSAIKQTALVAHTHTHTHTYSQQYFFVVLACRLCWPCILICGTS